MELVVQVYNINHGHNTEILKKCETLDKYSIFINKIREYQSQGYDLAESIKNTVEYCIKNKILEEFLMRYGTEVEDILLEGYTVENAMIAERKAGREEGRVQGKLEILDLLKNGKSPEEILKMYE